jgi:hypothetical protein
VAALAELSSRSPRDERSCEAAPDKLRPAGRKVN